MSVTGAFKREGRPSPERIQPNNVELTARLRVAYITSALPSGLPLSYDGPGATAPRGLRSSFGYPEGPVIGWGWRYSSTPQAVAPSAWPVRIQAGARRGNAN
jgi:hypothetical protein